MGWLASSPVTLSAVQWASTHWRTAAYSSAQGVLSSLLVFCLFAEDGLLKPKRERRSRERSHRSRSRDRKRSRRSRSRERRGGSKSRDRRRGGPATNGEVLVKQEVEDAGGEYGGSAGAENNYYNEHAGIDPANY